MLASGNLLVSVHIADVMAFVAPGSALDSEARRRATSTYFVHKVVPMLPPRLCEDLCSLNPGAERLAFTLEVELTPEGDLVRRWLGKSAMQSCCKMDYDAAQVTSCLAVSPPFPFVSFSLCFLFLSPASFVCLFGGLYVCLYVNAQRCGCS